MSSGNSGEVTAEFTVQYRHLKVNVVLPLDATLLDLKKKVETHTQLPCDKQRLLFNAPVVKELRKASDDAVVIRTFFSPSLLESMKAKASAGGAMDSDSNSSQRVIRVAVLLIGSVSAPTVLDPKIASEVSRLASTTVEQDGKWYRCSYSKGYLRQTAYVCRTCVNEGRADPAHSVCLACAEVCHATHEVEEWGVRYCMRCDCCTVKCWQEPGTYEVTEPCYAAAGRNSKSNMSDPPDVAASDASMNAKLTARDSFPTEVTAVTNADVAQRMKRKRSRSSSPLTPKRTSSSGNSPMSGVRVAAVANGPSPFSLHNQPDLEKAAVTAPVTTTASHQASQTPAPAAGPPSSFSTAAPTSSQHQQHQQQQEGDMDGENRISLREVTKCVFLVDSETGKPPVNARIPVNRKNRYPRNPLSWCFCKDDHPTDDPECGGIVCLLCTSCFWSVHLTRIHSTQYRRMPCYGDVLQGETLAFKCHTCDTLVCTSCRYRCHKDHEVDDQFIIPSREDHTDNGAPPGVTFSCGCRGLCSIAEAVPLEEIDDPTKYAPIPQSIAIELMNSDVFSGVVCGRCMQEYPWLMNEDPRKCWEGRLPPKVSAELILPVLPCGSTSPPADGSVFPNHGMLLPVNSFTEEMTCSCAACRAAFDQFAPRATEDATEMVMELHDQCDVCQRSIMGEQGFMCQTCEITNEQTFFLCRECNTLRLQKVGEAHRILPAGATTTTTTTAPAQGSGSTATTAEATQSSASEATTTAPSATTGIVYDHDLTHVFLEDTYENLAALFSMQLAQSLDDQSREYLSENWEAMQGSISISNTLSDTFGQTPVEFDAEDIKALMEENTKKPENDKKN